MTQFPEQQHGIEIVTLFCVICLLVGHFIVGFDLFSLNFGFLTLFICLQHKGKNAI